MIIDICETAIPMTLVARKRSRKTVYCRDLSHPFNSIYQHGGAQSSQDQDQSWACNRQAEMQTGIDHVVGLVIALEHMAHLGSLGLLDFYCRAGQTIGAANFLHRTC